LTASSEAHQPTASTRSSHQWRSEGTAQWTGGGKCYRRCSTSATYTKERSRWSTTFASRIFSVSGGEAACHRLPRARRTDRQTFRDDTQPLRDATVTFRCIPGSIVGAANSRGVSSLCGNTAASSSWVTPTATSGWRTGSTFRGATSRDPRSGWTAAGPCWGTTS